MSAVAQIDRGMELGCDESPSVQVLVEELGGEGQAGHRTAVEQPKLAFFLAETRQHLLAEAKNAQKDIKQEQQPLFSDPLPEIRRELSDILKMMK